MQHPQQHDRHRLAEVQEGRRLVQDQPGITQVRLYVVGRALRGAPQQGLCVQQDDRVVVDIDHPGIGGLPLGDLVRVVAGGDPGADVQELADAGLEPARYLVVRPRKARLARTRNRRPGAAASTRSAASRSTAKLSLPPSQ